MSEWLVDGYGGFRPAFPLIAFGIACHLVREVESYSRCPDRPARGYLHLVVRPESGETVQYVTSKTSLIRGR